MIVLKLINGRLMSMQVASRSCRRPSFMSIRRTHTCISGVQLHRLKTLGLFQHSTGPLPDTAHVRLATQLSALLNNRYRMPVLEAYIRPLQIDKQIMRLVASCCAGVAILRGLGWRGLVHAVIDQVAIYSQ
jgi:hypothetical protein